MSFPPPWRQPQSYHGQPKLKEWPECKCRANEAFEAMVRRIKPKLRAAVRRHMWWSVISLHTFTSYYFQKKTCPAAVVRFGAGARATKTKKKMAETHTEGCLARATHLATSGLFEILCVLIAPFLTFLRPCLARFRSSANVTSRHARGPTEKLSVVGC